jgi:hypothetical protein
MYICVSYEYTYTYTYKCKCVLKLYTHTHTFIYIYVYVYVYINMYMNIYIVFSMKGMKGGGYDLASAYHMAVKKSVGEKFGYIHICIYVC